jgi:hypothetical protein
LLVQASKALGKEQITPQIIKKFQKSINQEMASKVLKDTQHTTSWIYEVIKQVFSETV